MNTWDLTFYHLIAYAFKIIACISNLQRFEIMCPASFSLYYKNKKDLAFPPIYSSIKLMSILKNNFNCFSFLMILTFFSALFLNLRLYYLLLKKKLSKMGAGEMTKLCSTLSAKTRRKLHNVC